MTKPRSISRLEYLPPIKEFPAFTTVIKGVVGNLVNLLGNELNQLIQGFEKVYFAHEELIFEGWIRKFDQELQVEDFFSDGVHPSPLTYQIWGKRNRPVYFRQ